MWGDPLRVTRTCHVACPKDLCWGLCLCLSCHFYADDTQLYCSFKLQDQAASVQAIAKNMIKLNKDKTGILVIGKKQKVIPSIEGIRVAGKYIKVSSNAKNIVITFHTPINLNIICKTTFYHLRSI